MTDIRKYSVTEFVESLKRLTDHLPGVSLDMVPDCQEEMKVDVVRLRWAVLTLLLVICRLGNKEQPVVVLEIGLEGANVVFKIGIQMSLSQKEISGLFSRATAGGSSEMEPLKFCIAFFDEIIRDHNGGFSIRTGRNGLPEVKISVPLKRNRGLHGGIRILEKSGCWS